MPLTVIIPEFDAVNSTVCVPPKVPVMMSVVGIIWKVIQLINLETVIMKMSDKTNLKRQDISVNINQVKELLPRCFIIKRYFIRKFVEKN